MEPVLIKKEWIVKCLNCGHDANEGILYRKEVGRTEDGSIEYQIEVCRHCRYEEVAS